MSEELKPIAYLHKITEPDMEAMQVFSWSADNPWSHWLSSHMEKCSYSVTPLYASQARLSEAVKVLEQVSASLAWNAHGDCRAFHDGPIMPTAEAVDLAKSFLATLGEEK